MPAGRAFACQRPSCFNPRLPFPGGDACRRTQRSFGPARFNPRLPFPGGDAQGHSRCERRRVVSIHASRFREAMRSRTSRSLGFCVVSIHASRFREAMPCTASQRRAMRAKVSIHASRFREAMPLLDRSPCAGDRCFNPRLPFPGGDAERCKGARRHHPFQSTPPVSGRRCPTARNASPSWSKFQSTPPVSGRRCHGGTLGGHLIEWFQSTPPVSGRRCRRDSSRMVLRAIGFNPRLPFPGGDAPYERWWGVEILVSIHASRFREAMRHGGGRRPRLARVSIHASRFREAMP